MLFAFLRDPVREFLGINDVLRAFIQPNGVPMAVSQQDIVDAVTGEAADLATIGATLKNFLSDVDALLAAQPGSPDFTALLASIATNRATIGNLLGEVTAEDAKIAPPAAAPAPTA